MGDVNDTLGAAFRDIVDAFNSDLHTSIPAQVVKYDAATQTVDVQPMVKRVVTDDDGNESVESLPQITGVPVAFPSGGGYMVAFPIQTNDYVMLVFAERPIDTWLSSGNESDPGDLRHHDLSDAIAIPCIRPTSGAFTDADATKMVIGKSGGPQLVIDSSTVSLFSKSDPDFVALASKVLTELQNIKTYLDAHVHPTALGPSGPPASPMPPPQSVASAKVKTT